LGQARSLPCGEELCGYYEAALAYLDPRLPLEASLDEIVAAASRRQAELARRPLDSVRGELQELAEAVLFVQRSHPQVRGVLSARHEAANGRSPAAEDAVPVRLLFEADHSAPPAKPAPPVRIATAARAVTTMRGVSMAGDVVGSTALKPRLQTRPEPLELPQPARPEPARLPEDVAWPVAAGLLLLGWQAWLGCFSGWAVARLLAWPAPGYGLELGGLALAGVIALGCVTGLGVLLIARAYRVASKRLSLLVHLSGLALAVDLLAWWQAARRWPGLVEYPGWGWAVLVGALWLTAWGVALWHDARMDAARRELRKR
jgi:hypothetical protein